MDAALAPLADRVAPVTLAVERRLPGPEPLVTVLPDGGLQRGWSVGVAGPGGWSLAAALVAPVQAAEGWVAVVGAASFGLLAAAGYGLRLDRVVLVDQPPPERWATVVAALVDAVDAVLVDPVTAVPARDARRLRGRARERGAVLVHLDGGRTWPEAVDVVLQVEATRWEGLEAGHGHLRARRVVVTGTGRRLPGRPRHTELWLPGPEGGLAPVAQAPSASAASAASALSTSGASGASVAPGSVAGGGRSLERAG